MREEGSSTMGRRSRGVSVVVSSLGGSMNAYNGGAEKE